MFAVVAAIRGNASSSALSVMLAHSGTVGF